MYFKTVQKHEGKTFSTAINEPIWLLDKNNNRNKN